MDAGQCRRARAARGATAFEILVAVTILAVVVGTGVAAMSHSLRTTAEITSLSQARQAVSLLNIRLGDLLRESSVEPDGGVLLENAVAPDTLLNCVKWKKVTGWDAANDSLTYGPLRSIAFEYDAGETANDGVDNDGDGFIDEGRLVFLRDVTKPTEREVLATSVKNDFRVSLPAGGSRPGPNQFRIDVAVTLLYRNTDGTVGEVSQTSMISFRNGRSM